LNGIIAKLSLLTRSGISMPSYQRAIALYLALVVFFVAGVPAPGLPSQVFAASVTPLISDPTTLSTSVALGNIRRIRVNLQNTSVDTLTAQLYEAQPTSSPKTNLLAAIPADLAAVSLPDQAERVDSRLSALVAADPAAPTDFLVFLDDQADLSAAYRIADWKQRGQYVYTTLRDHAANSQASLRAMLDTRGVGYTPLWIVNALAVRGNAADMAAIAAHSEVAMLRTDELTAFDDMSADDATTSAVAGCLNDADNVCWNLIRIGADRVWNYFGVRGAGITVANIDSGVTYEHPALIEQYRGKTDSGFDHNYNWYDPYGSTSSPEDSGNHGTHTMGTIVAAGGDSPDTPAVGVAPGANWIAARACDASACTESNLILAAQWMLAPTDLNGNNPRPDLRPQVVNNSWSSNGGGSDWYAGYVAAWRAAGIFPVFAAGNNIAGNDTCSTIHSPGDYAQVVGVGALDSTNNLASYSRIGPTLDGRLKPDITAPGSGIASTISNRSYSSLSGTSMATPHVAGSVALLWSADPSLIGDYERTYQILTNTAVPLSGDTRFDGDVFSLCHATSSPNNIYGYGQLDVYAAVAETTVDVPWLSLPSAGIGPIEPGGNISFDVTIDTHHVPGPGTYQARILAHSSDLTLDPLVIPVTLTVPSDPGYATLRGKITRVADGSPLLGTVTVTNGPSVNSDASGAYQIVLPADNDYTVTASAFGYASQVTSFSLTTGEVRSNNFALDIDAPRLSISSDLQMASLDLGSPQQISYTLRNTGSKTLTYNASLGTEYYGVWHSTQADGPEATWIKPPANAITIGLTDDGISAPIEIGFPFIYFNQGYSTVSVGANGFLSFADLASSSSYIGSCLPMPETPNAALAVLRVDLDPSKPGARVSYANTDDGFLVSWTDVPLFDSAGQALSFQVLLRPDGRITLNYKQLGALTPNNLASIGVQQNNSSTQSLGCGNSLSLNSGDTIELRPQPEASTWANLPDPSGSIPPGGEVNLAVNLSWARMLQNWPASADIVLTTNDTDQPDNTLTVRMTSLPAPHTMFMLFVGK
jgi:subtilisin family serine protease